MKRQQSNFNRLPKSAVPVDKASYVGYSSLYGNQPARFVYMTKNKIYVIYCFAGVSPIAKCCYNYSDSLLNRFVENVPFFCSKS